MTYNWDRSAALDRTGNALYMKSHEIDQRADSRCPLGRAGGIEAR